MSGFAFYLGIGFSVLALAYTLTVLLGRDDPFGGPRRPYVMNGIALCLLGISFLGRDLFLHNRPWAVYLLWAAAGYLAIHATALIAAHGSQQRPKGRR